MARLASDGLQNEYLDLWPNRNSQEDSSPYLGEVLCPLISGQGGWDISGSEALILI